MTGRILLAAKPRVSRKIDGRASFVAWFSSKRPKVYAENGGFTREDLMNGDDTVAVLHFTVYQGPKAIIGREITVSLTPVDIAELRRQFSGPTDPELSAILRVRPGTTDVGMDRRIAATIRRYATLPNAVRALLTQLDAATDQARADADTIREHEATIQIVNAKLETLRNAQKAKTFVKAARDASA